jgi:selenophosphate synthetase-related protein
VPDLAELTTAVREAPGVRAKRDLALVARALPQVDGDDAALVEHAGEYLVLGGEAIVPAFVAANPAAAGAAAVVTSLADVHAMGGRPLGLVDTLVSPDREHAEQTLEGLARAADLLGVRVAGGHLTLGAAPALSAFCVGVAPVPLRAAAARPGDALVAAFCLEGEYLADGPFFSSLGARDPGRLRTDGEVLVEVAERHLAHAARDVSMPGVGGSLLQLIELAGCGATLDLDALPRPPEATLERWLVTFPSFGFVLAARPERAEQACEAFRARGLAAAVCGDFDATRRLALSLGTATATVWDLAREPLTGLAG